MLRGGRGPGLGRVGQTTREWLWKRVRSPVRAGGTHAEVGVRPRTRAAASLKASSTLPEPLLLVGAGACRSEACGRWWKKVVENAHNCRPPPPASLRAPSHTFYAVLMNGITSYAAVQERGLWHPPWRRGVQWRVVAGGRLQECSLVAGDILSVLCGGCVALQRPRFRVRSRQPRCRQM